MKIKNWFITKNFTQQESQAINNGYDLEVLKETEKAYQLQINTSFGTLIKWVPKSVIVKDHFNRGEVVKSSKFGEGIVLTCEGDVVYVDFNGTTKTMMYSFLERV